MPELHVRRGGTGTTSLGVTRSALLGRSRRADVWLPDRGVSARHALVRVTDAGTFVMDLGSQNGTFVNQRRVDTPVRLQPGDLLRLGDAIVEFRTDTAVIASPATVAVPVYEARASDTQVLLAVPVPAPAVRPLGDASHRATTRHAGLVDELGRLLMKSLDPGTLLPLVADRLLDHLPQAERVFVLRGTGDPLELAVARVRSGSADISLSRTLLRRVIERREALLYSDVKTDGPVGEADSLRVASMRAVMCAPVVFDDQVFGVLQVDTTTSIAAFSDADMHALVTVATQVAAALAYAALHARVVAASLQAHDLELARRIQRQFMPEHPPVLDGFEFAVEFEPALAVGGDFYDFLPLDRGRLALVVGDVSGKGVAAAIYAASVLAELRGLAPHHPDPVRLLHELNQRLAARDREGMFVTLALAILAADSGELTVATAGHPLPIVRDGAGAVVVLGQNGPPPVGIDPDAHFEAHRYALDVGDAVLAYTDGVPEAADAGGELFGQARVLAAVGAGDGSADGTCAAVMASVRNFLGGRPFGDDVTLVGMTRK